MEHLKNIGSVKEINGAEGEETALKERLGSFGIMFITLQVRLPGFCRSEFKWNGLNSLVLATIWTGTQALW